MTLSQLHIHHLRNITNTRLSLHPHCNILIGPNGSGKTSFLEAIYLIGTGHSFRTREITPLVEFQEQVLTVFVRTLNEDTISIQKSLHQPTQVRINQTPCQTSSELAHFLPCQVFYQDMFQIIDAGPAIRRSLLDWGLFHVKPDYHSIWKDYKRVLKQRNALLRRRAAPMEFIPWDKQLVTYASELHQLREEYFENWSKRFQYFLSELTNLPCEIQYYNGWDKKQGAQNLQNILINQFTSDLQRQHTQSGAHNADIKFFSNELKAKQTLSRGQQKILLIALKLAQASMIPKPCIYLLDDIMAELDSIHIQRLLSCLKEIKGQLFITSIESNETLKSHFSSSSATFYLNELCLKKDSV